LSEETGTGRPVPFLSRLSVPLVPFLSRYTTEHKTVDEMRDALKEAGLPNIFIPSADSFHKVDALPILGTGKLDLKGIKETAAKIYDNWAKGK